MRKARVRAENRGSWDLWSEQSEKDREMCLLFLDLRNFTPLTGLFPAHEVVHLVKKLVLTFQRIVRSHHGRIIETTGDGFYAAFGFHEDIQQSVRNAVAAGSAILKSLDGMNAATFEPNLGRRIEAGIGIHAGKVATGSITLGGEEHLMVMGHAVNIAARVQNATKTLNNNFLVSTSALASAGCEGGRSAKVDLKGVDVDFEVTMMGRAYAA